MVKTIIAFVVVMLAISGISDAVILNQVKAYDTQVVASVSGSSYGGVNYSHVESLNVKGPFYLSVANATTTGTAVTLQQSDLQPYNSLLVTPIVGSATVTLPASSTLSALLPKAGDIQQFLIVNSTSTAGINVTIAGGVGTLLKKASTTAAIAPGAVGELEFIRKANSDIDVFFEVGI